MAETDVTYEVVDGVASIVINRPQKMNSITFAMYERIEELCHLTSKDEGVKAVVFSGAGGFAFAAGTEITEFQSFKTSQDGLHYEKRVEQVLNALEECTKPTIAAIAGACTGGGAAIAVCCDLRIATGNVRFGMPIAKTLGNCLSIRNYKRFSALIGASRLKDLVFTGRLVDAGEGLAIGLFRDVVDNHAELLPRALSLAKDITSRAPLTLSVTKVALRRLQESTFVDDTDLIEICYGSEDFQEGIASFLQKRPPQWSGR